ncbi:hypothetical protein HPP92_005040 [Vanilla planifolia]|uniref:DUF7906 domain-containing protein n=1 Tax=Vanilla planifolia TaxID=51239 RepID=A0A835RKY7_VANPL|nr:hypothetical protein HPP92_005040 [Vanilla planifolia]
MGSVLRVAVIFSTLYLILSIVCSAPQPFRRDPGHPHWHHSAFHDVQESVRSDIRRMFHSRAEVPFQVPLEVGQSELIALEKALKDAMVNAGTARESEYGRELPLFEIEASVVEPIFKQLYSFIFDEDSGRYSVEEMDRPVPSAVFITNFDKVRMEPRNNETDLESLMYSTIGKLTDEQLKNQEGDYIYRYRYNGGGASQVWLSSGRYLVIDLSAGPCTYGKIETEEGSVSYRTLPRLSTLIFPRGTKAVDPTNELLMGHLGALISTTIEHVIAPDIRFETVDLTTRLLIPVIVLQNHNRYNILQAGHNYSIDVQAIEQEVKKMVHAGQEIIIFSGSYALHRHEKLAIALSKAMRSHSLQETKKDGRFHVHTKTYLDGAILKEEMERSADVLAAGLLEVSDPSLSSKFFLRQHWMDDPENIEDSIIKHKPLWESYYRKRGKDKKQAGKSKEGTIHKTYGTRVVPVFVLSMAGVNADLLMEDESLVWTNKDVVIVLQHENEKIPLSYVSETSRQYAFPSMAQRHIMAGLASVVGGLSAPYERASHVHGRPIVNWLWAAGCHPYGPFSNSSKISQMLHDVALRSSIYAHVDAALRKIRDTSEAVQSFASEHLKTPLGEPVKGKQKKSATELWVEKFYKKITNLPEPFPHELVERLEQYLDKLEEQLVDLSALLYDHRLEDAFQNSSDIFQSTIFTQHYVERVLAAEKEKMRCCHVEYTFPKRSSQAFVYGGILIAGFFVYFVVIFFSSPVR